MKFSALNAATIATCSVSSRCAVCSRVCVIRYVSSSARSAGSPAWCLAASRAAVSEYSRARSRYWCSSASSCLEPASTNGTLRKVSRKPALHASNLAPWKAFRLFFTSAVTSPSVTGVNGSVGCTLRCTGVASAGMPGNPTNSGCAAAKTRR